MSQREANVWTQKINRDTLAVVGVCRCLPQTSRWLFRFLFLQNYFPTSHTVRFPTSEGNSTLAVLFRQPNIQKNPEISFVGSYKNLVVSGTYFWIHLTVLWLEHVSHRFHYILGHTLKYVSKDFELFCRLNSRVIMSHGVWSGEVFFLQILND